MTQPAALAPVRATVTVKVPIERAFDFFTRRFAAWWPADHHVAEKPFEEIVVEPHVGGRWFERSADGTEGEWGRVLAWEPPSRLLLAWTTNAQWQYDPDLDHASHVEVRFIAEGERLTRVELTHSGIERHGLGAEKMRDAVGSPGGWPLIIESFRATVERAVAGEG